MNKKKIKKKYKSVWVYIIVFVDLPPSSHLHIKLPFFFLTLDVNESLF